MEFDIAIIGWGKGGKTLAAALADQGKSVAMIERSRAMYGGACINVACIPTKSLIHSAQTRTGEGYDPSVFQDAVGHRNHLTGTMRAKNFSMLNNRETVTIIDGEAAFAGPKTLRITATDDELEVTAETIIINTGSVPRLPHIEGAEIGGRIHTSVSLQQAHLPKHLIIVGGGYIGLEFASMFSQFGSEVTVLDRSRRPLLQVDRDVAFEVASSLKDSRVRLVSGADVFRICQDADSTTVQYLWNEQEQTVRGDAVLIALGRRPDTDSLNLAAAGIETAENGAVVVDEHLRTSVPGIYAVGDVNGGPQFTYISLDDYRIVLDQLTGDGTRSTADRQAVPSTTFTTPPFSTVGITEKEARNSGRKIKVAVKKVADIAAMPRPKIVGDPRGIIKIIVDAQTDLILGAALVHVDSQEVINLVSLAMRHGVTASQLRDSIYTHPSSTEALNEVLSTI